MLSGEDTGVIRVAIVDDHELVRTGLRMVLEAEEDMEVAFEAVDGREAVERVREIGTDVLLLDLRMPGMDGVRVCREVCRDLPDVRVVVLTSFDSDDEVFGALSAGAVGYIMKDIAPDELVRTIRGVAHGLAVLDVSVTGRLVEGRESSTPGPTGLSERETEVLRLMARGFSNREIAEELWISPATVKTHVSSVLHKLGQRDRTQAVLAAIRSGLVEPGEAE